MWPCSDAEGLVARGLHLGGGGGEELDEVGDAVGAVARVISRCAPAFFHGSVLAMATANCLSRDNVTKYMRWLFVKA